MMNWMKNLKRKVLAVGKYVALPASAALIVYIISGFDFPCQQSAVALNSISFSELQANNSNTGPGKSGSPKIAIFKAEVLNEKPAVSPSIKKCCNKTQTLQKIENALYKKTIINSAVKSKTTAPVKLKRQS